MCKNPCESLKIAVCQHETQCESISFLMPCGSGCKEFKTYWDRRKRKNYTIDKCDKCKRKIGD